jgi:hypothetical protein
MHNGLSFQAKDLKGRSGRAGFSSCIIIFFELKTFYHKENERQRPLLRRSIVSPLLIFAEIRKIEGKRKQRKKEEKENHVHN